MFRLLFFVIIGSAYVQGLFNLFGDDGDGKNVQCATDCNCTRKTINLDGGASRSSRYRPVVLMHGVMQGYEGLEKLRARIQEKHPGTRVFNLNCYSGMTDSLKPLWEQVKEIGAQIMAICEAYPRGIHLLGYSQGGLIARAVLELFPDHNVHTFISLSSPQAGQCGSSKDWVLKRFSGLTCKEGHRVFYNEKGQEISIANYWNDPFNQSDYLKSNEFLPIINNEVRKSRSMGLERGLKKLKKMILIGGPKDGVITPWQSAQFGYYRPNSTEVCKMHATKLYQTDAIGLKTLDRANKLKIYTVDGIIHTEWPERNDIIDQYILPHLD